MATSHSCSQDEGTSKGRDRTLKQKTGDSARIKCKFCGDAAYWKVGNIFVCHRHRQEKFPDSYAQYVMSFGPSEFKEV